jgi:hypothetical protein
MVEGDQHFYACVIFDQYFFNASQPNIHKNMHPVLAELYLGHFINNNEKFKRHMIIKKKLKKIDQHILFMPIEFIDTKS